MEYEQETVRTLYKKLLGLYPRAFKERLGESMEQTFNDLCNERKQQTERGLFGFVLWEFVGTARGIIREQVQQISEGDIMKTFTKNLGLAAIVSFILVLPFAILEVLNNTITRQNAPGLILLFGVLWLLPTAFIVILTPLVRTVRAGNSIWANPVKLLFKVGCLALIATIWGWGFIDQLPCFLGVPNCD
ncbi:MAG: hypothetical protein LC776_05710 [Acidobacteria bacterium]|nr:hypothetical protein [Acidobacteriota bacterium]